LFGEVIDKIQYLLAVFIEEKVEKSRKRNMKTYTAPPIILILCSLSFTLFAQDNVCDAYPLPERNAPIFPYGVNITETSLTQQIEHLVKVETYSDCQKDSTLFEFIDSLNKDIQKLEANIASEKKKESQTNAIKASITTLEKSLNEKKESVEQKNIEKNSLSVHFKKICNVQNQADKSLNSSMLNCLAQLKESLNHENIFYPDDVAISEGADNAEQQRVDNLNTKNKYKSQLVNSDLNIIENLIATETLEKSPSSISILKGRIKESNLGADTIVLLDILNTKSAQMKIFKQKLKVLERNSRFLTSKLHNEECRDYYSYKEKFTILNLFSQDYENLENKYNKMPKNQQDSCDLVQGLIDKLDRTLKLSYKDSWFENRNLESEINDIETLLTKLQKLEADKSEVNTASVVQRLNFLNHANEYFEKYNNTGRFNIGLGAALFNAPDIITPIDLTLNLSQFTVTSLDPQLVQHEFNIPSGKKLSPIIVATMPWVDVTLTLPEYSNNFTYISDINTWQLPLEGEQTQHSFLSRTTIESDYQIDYDINMTIKLVSFLREFFPSTPWWFKNTKAELALGIGTTDIQLTTEFTTDIREQVNLDEGYSQLASLHPLETKETIDHSMQYGYFGAHYYMADQIRMEAYWKGYKSSYKEGKIKLATKSSWGINVTYLFF
jgi:hypothetical protein